MFKPVCVFLLGPEGNTIRESALSSFDIHVLYADKAVQPIQQINLAIRRHRPAGSDVLLLGADVDVTSDALQEMRDVLYAHEKHAVVAPRSNADPLLPISFPIWTQTRSLLSRYQVVPFASWHCAFIAAQVLDRFDLVADDDAGTGDLWMGFLSQINRCGYSALLANQAFVESPSSAEPASAEAESTITKYRRSEADPVDLFALLRHSHRPQVLFDLYHLSAHYSGTSEFALNLLRELAPLVQEKWDLSVRVGAHGDFFSTELVGYQLYKDELAPFDLVFRPSQLFTWTEFAALNRLAPRIALTLLDIISARCEYLSTPQLKDLLRAQGELCDVILPISDFSRRDFETFFGLGVQMPVVRPGATCPGYPIAPAEETYILVIGNRYAHKGVADALRAMGTEWPILVVGDPNVAVASNVRVLSSGSVSRREMYDLFSSASLIVYPSYYEGYGLPVVDSLALGKVVIALDSDINRELLATTRDSNLHLIASLKDLNSAIRDVWGKPRRDIETAPRSWKAAAQEYVEIFEGLLAQDVNVQKLRQRWRLLRLLENATGAGA